MEARSVNTAISDDRVQNSAREDATYPGGRVGHRPDNATAGGHPGLHLADGKTRTDRDEQLSLKSLFGNCVDQALCQLGLAPVLRGLSAQAADARRSAGKDEREQDQVGLPDGLAVAVAAPDLNSIGAEAECLESLSQPLDAFRTDGGQDERTVSSELAPREPGG